MFHLVSIPMDTSNCPVQSGCPVMCGTQHRMLFSDHSVYLLGLTNCIDTDDSDDDLDSYIDTKWTQNVDTTSTITLNQSLNE